MKMMKQMCLLLTVVFISLSAQAERVGDSFEQEGNQYAYGPGIRISDLCDWAREEMKASAKRWCSYRHQTEYYDITSESTPSSSREWGVHNRCKTRATFVCVKY